MACQRWHILKEQGALTLARRLPARFDVAVMAVIEGGAGLRKSRIAAQVRQDMWRSLQNLRGFAPVVRVAERGGNLEITAGGTVAGRFPKSETEACIRTLLESEDHRARWVRFAREARR
ncbi:hypothetical protein [Celeribacter persicus]|uniref:Uncharacterized protein n=1 Tax=Celeribacter persicus TaxID=1651082 RepID=A0A2T5HI37_9RHOB|nr:hypothetical protein [Celeribacter persicus]PTQ71233.1 hypothetical protein C8N42_1085 [Celeribacter persicus]